MGRSRLVFTYLRISDKAAEENECEEDEDKSDDENEELEEEVDDDEDAAGDDEAEYLLTLTRRAGGEVLTLTNLIFSPLSLVLVICVFHFPLSLSGVSRKNNHHSANRRKRCDECYGFEL